MCMAGVFWKKHSVHLVCEQMQGCLGRGVFCSDSITVDTRNNERKIISLAMFLTSLSKQEI